MLTNPPVISKKDYLFFELACCVNELESIGKELSDTERTIIKSILFELRSIFENL